MRKQPKRYVLLDKIEDEVSIYKDLSVLCKDIGIGRSTFYYKNTYENDKYKVYEASFVQQKSKRGGKRR